MSEKLYTRVDWGVLDAEGQVKMSGFWDNTTWREKDAIEECKALNDNPNVIGDFKPFRPVMLVFEDAKPPEKKHLIQWGVMDVYALSPGDTEHITICATEEEAIERCKQNHADANYGEEFQPYRPIMLIYQEIEP